MKNKIMFVFGSLALTALVGCNASSPSNSTGDPSSNSANLTMGVNDDHAANEAIVLGTPMSQWNVMGRAYSVDGIATAQIDDSTFAGYAILAARSAELAKVSHVIATKEDTLELYDQDALVMIITNHTGAVPTISYSKSGFLADSMLIAFNSAPDTQSLQTGSIRFDLSECLEPSKLPDQGQADNGQADKGQADKGQAAQICKHATIELSIQELMQTKPDQGQGKTPAPDQGQGKTPAPDQGQGKTPAPDQGQGKTPAPDQDQGKTPAPDQGQDK